MVVGGARWTWGAGRWRRTLGVGAARLQLAAGAQMGACWRGRRAGKRDGLYAFAAGCFMPRSHAPRGTAGGQHASPCPQSSSSTFRQTCSVPVPFAAPDPSSAALSSLAIFSRFSNHIHLPSPDPQPAASSSYVPPWPISAPIRYPTPTGQLPQRSLHRHLSRALIPLEHSSGCSGSVRYVLCRGAVPSLHLYMCLFSLSQGFPPACSEC